MCQFFTFCTENILKLCRCQKNSYIIKKYSNTSDSVGALNCHMFTLDKMFCENTDYTRQLQWCPTVKNIDDI